MKLTADSWIGMMDEEDNGIYHKVLDEKITANLKVRVNKNMILLPERESNKNSKHRGKYEQIFNGITEKFAVIKCTNKIKTKTV